MNPACAYWVLYAHFMCPDPVTGKLVYANPPPSPPIARPAPQELPPAIRSAPLPAPRTEPRVAERLIPVQPRTEQDPPSFVIRPPTAGPPSQAGRYSKHRGPSYIER
jgi:hypothetical protein